MKSGGKYCRPGSKYRVELCFRQPVSEAEEGADFPAFVPALLDLGNTLIREAERVFVSSNEVDHRVGCFHQDVFPFWLFVRALSEPKGCQLRERSRFFWRHPSKGAAVLSTEVPHLGNVAA
jgi:hypothetical protein